MAETPETHEYSEPESADSPLTLTDIGKRLDSLSAAVLRLQAQSRSNGEQASSIMGRLDTQRDALAQVHSAVIRTPDADPLPGTAAAMLTEVLATVREAAPLLQSRAARALKAGGNVLDYLKAGRG